MHFPTVGGTTQRAITTAGDLRSVLTCEFGVLVTADVLLGRREIVLAAPDPVRERFGDLGRQREAEVTEVLSREVGEGVVHADALRPEDLPALLADPATRLVHQAPVRGERFAGRADHLLREEAGWVVAETKLASSAKLFAQLQVASYAQALADDGVAVAPFVRLYLGDGSVVEIPREDLAEHLARVTGRLREILDTHQDAPGPVVWGDPRWKACLHCDACRAEMEVRGDVGLVRGVRPPTRLLLIDAGVRSMADLAARTEPVEGVAPETLVALSSQARLQLTEPTDAQPLAYEVHDPAALAAMPAPTDGDVFFDFEGDPVWRDGPADHVGLEYLFGCLTPQEEFVAFWAHDREQERAALIEFVAWLQERRRRWPALRVYHYADYEKSALTRLAARHGVLEAEVAQLIADGVFVDLYAVVKSAVRVGSASYSIKRLEPLYMGDDLRDADGVTAGGDSIIEYQRYREAVAAGDDADAAARLEALRAYNEYDCLSTLRLRDWLLTHAD